MTPEEKQLKQELQEQLKTKGVEVIRQWGIQRLQEEVAKLVQTSEVQKPTEEMLKAVKENILGTDKPTREEIMQGAVEDEAGKKLKSGIILPFTALQSLPETKFVYTVDSMVDKARVYRTDHRGKEEFVREYDRGLHGDNFKELAEQFAKKNTK